MQKVKDLIGRRTRTLEEYDLAYIELASRLIEEGADQATIDMALADLKRAWSPVFRMQDAHMKALARM